jgi:hypothetical protein
MSQDSKSGIITVPSLSSYFFESLLEVNRESVCPVLEETLLYSSDVLEKFSSSEEFFEVNEGKVREKILGEKLLKATAEPFEIQKAIYKDIGDTSLFLCGYFGEATNKRIVDRSYYRNLGITAFSRLNSLIPRALDIPSFFNVLATSFEPITTIISEVAAQDASDPQRHLIIEKMKKVI